MANKHINKLISKTKKYFDELNLLDSEAVRISSNSMVDPEEWAEITGDIRGLAIHLSNINSVLSMALDSKDFTQALSSRRNLVKSIKQTLSRVQTEQPGSELVESYSKVLKDHEDTLFLLEQTNKFRSFPKAKKKYSNWDKKGLIDKGYIPFSRVELTLIKIKNSLEV